MIDLAEWEVFYLENCPQCRCDRCGRPLIQHPFNTEFYVNKRTKAHICESCKKGAGSDQTF